MKKRLIAILLSLAMMVSLLPMGAFAIEVDENGNVVFRQVENNKVSASLLGDLGDAYEQSVTYEEDDIVRISIYLEGNSTIDEGYSTESIAENDQAMDYREELEAAQEELIEKIEALLGEDLDVQWNLTLVANVISANVKYGQIRSIVSLDGVEKVVLETQYAIPESVDSEAVSPLMSGSSEMTGTGSAWLAGYTGAGMRIAIIDTGLDTDHQSFANAPYLYALQQNAAAAGMSYEDYIASLDLLDQEELAQKLSKLHIMEKNKASTAENTYISEKIPFAFNYVDGLYDYVTHDEDDATDHGSHVAGIATANRYVEKNGEMVDAKETVRVAGNAPDAQVIVMKVFGKLGGAYTSDFMAAIEDAIILGCDSINLSLGTKINGFSDAGEFEAVMESLEKSDAVVAIAAGNEGYAVGNAANSYYLGDGYLYADDVFTSTIGSPGSYTNSLCVASVDNAKVTMNGFFTVDGTTKYTPEFTETLYNNMKAFSSLDISDTQTGTTYEYIFLDGIGTESEYDFLDVTGKIVIVSRGSLPFYEKASIAVSKGAVATIVYNNTAGTIGMDLTDYLQEAPAIAITKDAANKIRAMSQQQMDGANNVYYTGTITVIGGQQVVDSNDPYYTMSYFSSWGTTGDLALKPEITAPGGNIYSVRGDVSATNRYKLNSGTSMASPQVAGIAAIASQFIQTNKWNEKTGFSIRQLAQSLLMSTAVPMLDANGNYYPLLQQGAGLANAQGIVSADSFIMMGADATASWSDGKVKAELGDDPDRTGIYEFTFTIYNMSGEEKTFALSAKVFTQDVTEKYTTPENENYKAYFALESTKALESTAIFDTGAQVVVAAGGSQQVKVQLKLTQDSKQWLDTYFKNGAYIQAYVFAEPLGDSEGVKTTTHSIPVLAFYGNWTDPSMFEGGSAYEGEILSNYSTPNTTDHSRYPYAFVWQTDGEPHFRYNALYVENGGGVSYNWSAIYALGGNPMVKDPYYMPERNAISSGVTVRYWSYVSWRDTAIVGSTVENVTTGETYYKSEAQSQQNGIFYDKNNVAWQMGVDMYYVNQALPQANDGDVLRLMLYALPEYYLDDRMGADSAWGSGAELSIELNVDGTKPQVSDITYQTSGALSITASDNNYISAVVLYTADGKQVVSYTGSKVDIEKGETAVYTVDTASFGATQYLLQVYDYAMNASTYSIEIDESQIVYSGALLAYNMDDGTWIQLDKHNEMMGAVTEVTKTYTAAAAVGNTIYTIAYGTELQKLSVSDPSDYAYVGDTGYTLVDLAYNAQDGYLYGVTDESKLVRVNPATGKGTLLGTIPVNTNTLACDPDGIFYCNQYGTGRIYSFTLDALKGGDLRYDFNGDRTLNEADGQALMDYLTGSSQTIQKSENADLDGDGDVDTYDAYCLFDLLPARTNLIAELPVSSKYAQALEADPNSGALYWASYSTEQIGDTEISFSILYGIDTRSGAYARYGDHTDQLTSLVVLDKDAGSIYGPLTGTAKITEADADKRSQYDSEATETGAIACLNGVDNTAKAQLMSQQQDNMVSVTLTANNRTFNGLYTITYDPAVMELVDVTIHSQLTSFHDAANAVTIAFANNPAIAGGEVVAVLTFAVQTCDAFVIATKLQENNAHTDESTQIDAGAHQWNDWTTTDEATCVADGLQARSCALCGCSETQRIPANATAHSWGQWNTETLAFGNQPGGQSRTCQHCQKTQNQWTTADSLQTTPVDSWFNYLWVGQIYIDSARITGARVNDVKKITTTDGSVRYIVELSDQTALNELVKVNLTAQTITGSGFGQAIRKNPGENIGWQDHELDYMVQLEGGWGQMTAYSYDNSTECTQFHLYFHVGDGGVAYKAPTYVATPDSSRAYYDNYTTQIGIWSAVVDKVYWQDEITDEQGDIHITGYIWLEPETDPNATLEIEFLRSGSPLIYAGHSDEGTDLARCGTTVTLENGKATLEFTSVSNTSEYSSRPTRYYTVYLRNEINNAPECHAPSGSARLMIGETYGIDLSTIFADSNGDKLQYTVSVNGGEAVEAAQLFRYVPDEVGMVTLVFTASDGFLASECYTVTLTVLEEYLPGDVNNDGVVNMMDVTLLKRFLAGWDIEITQDAADVNNDGELNMMDVTLLRRYLAGWDVELK